MNIDIIFQLLALAIVLIAGPLVIVLLASRNGNL
uniref:Photosystem II reaction center protein Psb30 n=1 Tax=Derbesia sp. WEST4838 TaxID=1847751 RepID=A0A1C9JBG7_9CHLO|nr:photosystem II protein [Derbesia sp. WEST4838]AOP19195.1 photosystem II protein [Derbesia sp. WEST4838]